MLSKKEYQLFRKNLEISDKVEAQTRDDAKKNIIPKFALDKYFKSHGYLSLQAHQIFTKNYFNPNTEHTRLLLKWETGIGKTIAALSIALNFINYYQKEQRYAESDDIGSVYIIGFTRRIFIEELL